MDILNTYFLMLILFDLFDILFLLIFKGLLFPFQVFKVHDFDRNFRVLFKFFLDLIFPKL